MMSDTGANSYYFHTKGPFKGHRMQPLLVGSQAGSVE